MALFISSLFSTTVQRIFIARRVSLRTDFIFSSSSQMITSKLLAPLYFGKRFRIRYLLRYVKRKNRTLVIYALDIDLTVKSIHDTLCYGKSQSRALYLQAFIYIIIHPCTNPQKGWRAFPLYPYARIRNVCMEHHPPGSHHSS